MRRAAAVPMPDSVFGERICVSVEPAEDASPTLGELIAFLGREGRSKECYPEALVVVPALPESAGGKIAKRPLRDDLARHLDAGRVEPAPHVEAPRSLG